MYLNQTTERGVNKILKVVFLLVAIGIIVTLGKFVVERLDPDTGGMTVTSVDEEDEKSTNPCSETSIKAMRENGLPVPVKCKKKS